MQKINQELFLFINQLAGQGGWLDFLAIYLAGVTPFIFIALLLISWFYLDEDKRYGSFLASFSVLLAMLLSYLIGKVFFHPRPFMDGLGVQLVQHAPDTSFPSDHTTFVFAIAFSFFFFLASKRLGWWLLSLSFVSGLARVFIAVHYPGDILGAIAIGAFAAWVINRLNNKTTFFKNSYKLFNFLRFSVKQ